MEYRQAMGFVGKLSYTDQKKLLPNFLKFKVNKRGVSFLGECICQISYHMRPNQSYFHLGCKNVFRIIRASNGSFGMLDYSSSSSSSSSYSSSSGWTISRQQCNCNASHSLRPPDIMTSDRGVGWLLGWGLG